MKIGITFDLRDRYIQEGMSLEDVAEFDSEATIAAIEAAIKDLGHKPERIGGAKDLIVAVASGRRWDLVFNIAEGLKGKFRESLVPAILEHYQIPYTFSDPLAIATTLDKALAKKVVSWHGIPTASFCLIRSSHEVDKITFGPPFFVKPNQEGTGKGIDKGSLLWDMEGLKQKVDYLTSRFGGPALVEEYLPGREFTVGILGEQEGARPLGTVEVLVKDGSGIYSFEAKEACEELVDYLWLKDEILRRQIEDVALRAYKSLDLRDAGRIDIRLSEEGMPMFLEANPLPGLHPTHSDLPIIASLGGMSYQELIASIIGHASKRIQ